MEFVDKIIVPLIIGVLASSGFWALLDRRNTKTTGQTRMLIGLAHDRIRYLALQYIDRGWISQDEYEDLVNYLYKPYQDIGGNGSALRLMEQVNKLPLKPEIALKEKEI